MLSEKFEAHRYKGYVDLDKLEEGKDYTVIGREQRGTLEREKDWIDIEGQQFLVRTEMFKNEAWTYMNYAELITKALADQVGIVTAEYDLVKYKGEYGVISRSLVKKDEEDLITALNIFHNVGHEHNEDKSADMYAVLDAFNENMKFANAEKSEINRMNVDIMKLAVFDIFTLATDRHLENFAMVYSKDRKQVVGYDNECSLMLDQPMEMVDKLLEDDNLLEDYVSLQNPLLGTAYDQDRDYSMPEWAELMIDLYENSPIAQKTIDNMNEKLDISAAIATVEQQINYMLPDKLKVFVSKVFQCRMRQIQNTLGIEREENDGKDNR